MTTEQSGPVGSDSSEGLGGGAPVAWGMPNSAITGSTRWMMLRENLPSNDQYGGALWTPLYAAPQPAERVPPDDWSVFNSGAEVASGLSYREALDYMTPARLELGWSAVCVVNIDNVHGIRAAGVKEPGNAGITRPSGSGA